MYLHKKVTLIILVCIPLSLFSQNLKVSVESSIEPSICKGSGYKVFYLDAEVKNGTPPYQYEWTGFGITDTIRYEDISIRVNEGGTVKLKLTDNSKPSRLTKTVTFKIKEIEVKPDFNFNTDTLCAETPITFYGSQTGGQEPVSYNWRFGDGYTSLDQNTEHAYISSGCSGESVFNVELRVTDKNYCYSTITKDVVVKKKPHLSFSDGFNVGVSEFKHCHLPGDNAFFEVQLQNNSTNTFCIAKYTVDWGDGNITENATFPLVHGYIEAGAFELVVTAENSSGCDLSWSHFVYNQSIPGGGVVGVDGSMGCAPISIPFVLEGWESNSVGTTYTWDFGDGSDQVVWDHNQPFSNDTIWNNYTSASCELFGTNGFLTTVIIENGCGVRNGTSDGTAVWIKPDAAIDDGDFAIDTICVNEVVELMNNSTSGFYGPLCDRSSDNMWTSGDGDTIVSNTSEEFSWSDPGDYYVSLTVGNLCGSTTDSFKIVVVDPLEVNASLDTYQGCSEFQPVVTNNSVGQNMTFNWKVEPTVGVNINKVNSKEPKLSFSKYGDFELTLYAINACGTKSASFDIEVFDKPVAIISNLPDICEKDAVISPEAVFFGRGKEITSYDWSFSGGLPGSSSLELPGVINYSDTGSYIVHLSVENECGSRSTADTFIVQIQPEIITTTNISTCEDDPVFISGTKISDATGFEWYSLGDGVFNSNTSLNPIYVPGSDDIANSQVVLICKAYGVSPCQADSVEVTLNIKHGPEVSVDDNAILCHGESYEIIDAQATKYDHIVWTTSGDGYFSDTSIMHPVYYPGNQDLKGGIITLMLNAYAQSPCNDIAQASFNLQYAKVPVINAGSDADICKNGNIQLAASGTDYTSLRWYPLTSDMGDFSSSTVLNPLFNANNTYAGNEMSLVIEASGGFSCPVVTDTVTLTIIPEPKVSAGNDGLICETSTFQVNEAKVNDNTSFDWKVNGDGTINSNVVLDPVYTPGPSDIASGSATLTLTAYGNSVCAEVSENATINIQGIPVANAGADEEICKVYNFSTKASHVNGSAFKWITLGSGVFIDDSQLNTTYEPSDEDKNKGMVDLVLEAIATSPCMVSDFDTVRLTFIDPPEVFAGNDTTICAADFNTIKAGVLNSTQIVWATNGTGVWINKDQTIATYSPSEKDISKGEVILTLASLNQSCPKVEDEMILTLIPHPLSYAGNNALICEDKSYNLSGISQHSSGFEWSGNGDGTFVNITDLNTVYTPGSDDKSKGKVKIYLTSFGLAPCSGPHTDSLELSIQRNPIVFAGTDKIIGEGEDYVAFEATASDYREVHWTSLGDGTFNNSSVINPTYIPGTEDLANRGVKLVISATSLSPCLIEVTDTVDLIITPKPEANAGLDQDICEGSSFMVSGASAKEYSEVFWETNGSGMLKDKNTFTPTYEPSEEDIENRKVVLTLNARGKFPIEDYIHQDEMVLNIVHNAQLDAIATDTACENKKYTIEDVFYKDVADREWTTSGTGYFNNARQENPVYSFSGEDGEGDEVLFYVKVYSIDPCIYIDYDTMKMQVFHEPEPDFDYTPHDGCAPLDVGFTNTSVGEELEYNWDMGNGIGSKSENPGNVVYEQGRVADTTYNIILTASNRCNTISKSQSVLVKPIPIVDFGMDVSWGCSPKDIHFFNVTTGLADTYLWKWGDGKPFATDEQPGFHVFETEKKDTVYAITLIAENECGVDSLQKFVTIFPNNVTAFFETDTNFGCVPFDVRFTNFSRGVVGSEPLLSWSWNFGDGNISTEKSPVHTFSKPGTYTVTLYVNDTCSFDTAFSKIVVYDIPKVDFITDKQEYCGYDTVQYTPVNMDIELLGGMLWEFGDSTVGRNYNEAHIYNEAGQYEIVLTATDIINGCANSLSKNIAIREVPEAKFSIPENDACQPLDITFSNESVGADYFVWDFGNSNKSISLNSHEVFHIPGNYKIKLEVSNKFGCINEFALPLKVNPKPEALFETSSSFTCFPPVDVSFTNISVNADDFLWDFNNALTSTNTNPTTTFNAYGDYNISLIATNKYFCKDTAEFTYHVYHNPEADFSVDSTIGCDPFSVKFYNQSKYGKIYLWEFNHTDYSENNEPVYIFEGSGLSSVMLKVIGDGGCSDSIVKENFIKTNPSPVSQFEFSRINEGDSVQFYNTSEGGVSYTWDFGDLETSDEIDPLHRYKDYDSFMVSLTTINEYNCPNTYTEEVVIDLLKGLFMPNAFSPNNFSEKVRDFMPVGIGLEKYHVQIFDTWGNLMWETTRLEKGRPVEQWDGTYKGEALNPDVYVWHIKEAVFKDKSIYNGPKYGTITIIK